MLAYNLGEWLKWQVLPEEYRTAMMATLQWKLYRLAGKLVLHARLWVLRIRAHLEKWRLLDSARLGEWTEKKAVKPANIPRRRGGV